MRPRTPKAFWTVAAFSTRSCGLAPALPESVVWALTVFTSPRLKTPPTPLPARAVVVVMSTPAQAPASAYRIGFSIGLPSSVGWLRAWRLLSATGKTAGRRWPVPIVS